MRIWSAGPSDNIEFFEQKIRPILVEKCYLCHGPQLQQKGLRLDSREAILTGGSRGPAIVPYDVTNSLLMQAVRHESLAMPPAEKLTDEQIGAIEKWISLGAPWPTEIEQPLSPGDPRFYEQITKQHWAFQPVKEVAPPNSDSAESSVEPIDRFIRQKLTAEGLLPAPLTSPQTLIRRLSLVLTGLPPNTDQMARFLANSSPASYETIVDELLNSVHFGEHWARHWMDVVRFAETLGNDWNYEINGASHYRDYLIRAFNADVPYDQLIREHIAGDLLDQPRINKRDGINESLAGLNFYRFGEQGHDDCAKFREIRTDVVADQIDTLGKAFQGLTIACAQCHDHKLDPIPTKDYYRLYSVLSSSRMVTRTLDTPDINETHREELRRLKLKIRNELASLWIEEGNNIATRLHESYLSWKYRPQPRSEEVKQLTEEQKGGLDSVLFGQEKVTWEDPLFIWMELHQLVKEHSKNFAKSWRDLAIRYDKEAASRSEFNRDYFNTLVDFRDGSLHDWSGEGQALSDAIAAPGEFAISPEGPNVLSNIFLAGIYSHKLSGKLNAAIRSPLLPQDKLFVSIQAMGGKLGSWRMPMDNCSLSDDYDMLETDSLKWVRIPTKFENHSYPSYIELVTRHDNPRFPERPYMNGRTYSLDQIKPRSYFGVAKVVTHDCEAVPENELTHLTDLFSGVSPKNFSELAALYASKARQAISAWATNKATDDDTKWISWLIRSELLPNSVHINKQLADLVKRYRAVELEITEPRVINGMIDLEAGRDYPVLERGNPENPGVTAHRGFLQLITKSSHGFDVEQSGRREMAEIIADPKNPLTARVMVNRIWHHVFGRGIVSTVNNLGRLGEKPSHPKLLDYLAIQFVQQRWSIKQFIRQLVLTRTFRQASNTSKVGSAVDPENRLLHRYPVRRLDAEMVRDSILATAGTLNRKLFGPSIHPYRKDPQDPNKKIHREKRKLFSGPLDGKGRRSIYIKVTRHEGDRFLELFDFPIPSVSRGQRNTTNIPGQPLALLNHPFVLQQAGVWADQVMEELDTSVDKRIDKMFEVALGRRPEAVELDRLRGLVSELASLHVVKREEMLKSRPVWKDLAHSLFNLKEFIYIR